MTDFTDPPAWEGPSEDPTDEQFGDVVEVVGVDAADDCDAVLVGEPYDGGVIGRPGAAEGPDALRAALAATKTHHFASGPVGRVGDLGDVEIPSTASTAAVQADVREGVAAVHRLAALPVFLGGDNSLTYANVRPLLERGSVGVVSLDAHLDCREVRDEPTSGTPYRQLLEAGLDGFAVLGARHFETSTAYHRWALDQGATVVTAGAVAENPAGAVDDALAAMRDVEYLYVSVDLDVLDAAAAPGVSAPTPGGLTTRELFRLLGELAARRRLAGVEVVECAPPLDRDDLTVRAGARAVAHVLAGYQPSRREAQP